MNTIRIAIVLIIHRIPAFRDNYFWLFHAEGEVAATVVDPGDAQPVLHALKELHLRLAAILVTHHHRDHTGGIAELTSAFPVPVYGPDSPHIPTITNRLADGDQFELADEIFQVLGVPGHTLDHLAYFSETTRGHPVLFCGDTLFAGGCGRLFEGTAAQMLASLHRLARLPANTAVYCAHEYTQANLEFATLVDPQNVSLANRKRHVDLLRRQGLPTIPTDLETELQTNPFLRCDEPALKQSAATQSNIVNDNTNEAEVFQIIRRWKDRF